MQLVLYNRLKSNVQIKKLTAQGAEATSFCLQTRMLKLNPN